MTARKKAVVLLSGGLDSTTALAIARSADYALYAMSFRYGQRHSTESESANRVAKAMCDERPLIGMTKAEIIENGLRLGVDYSLTHSCYDPTMEGIACGHCDSCRLRLKGFAEAGAPDPLRYAAQ